MARPKLSANPWLRGALIGAGVLFIGGAALGGCDSGTAIPTISGNVSTITTIPTDTTTTIATTTTTPVTSTVDVPIVTTVPLPAPTTVEAAVPQQGSGGSGGSETSCGSDSYVNSDGQCVHDPVQAPSAPTGATAKCQDGSYSFSKHHSGTCSGHGGVAEWLS